MSTHDIYCKKCRCHIAWWSMYDNIQYQDEYECCGKVWKKLEGYWCGKKWTGNFKPTKSYMKEIGITSVKPKTKELRHCSIINYSQYCSKCAKELHYKCPDCGKKIKLVRKK